MKKVLSTLVAALVALSFSAAAFAADVAPAPAAATDTKPAVEKKDDAKPCNCNTTKKLRKPHKKAAKKEAAPAAEVAPAAK